MNRLAHETSPYLRQHADNPVDWYPWGAEAFERAKEHDRPILLSIGYASCHWCHVMAHESFEDPATAEELNRLFVNVKVDREEHPEVDAIYMDAVAALTGHGGWPMTVFLTPDGRPFFGGTYFPRHRRSGIPSLLEVSHAAEEAWRTRRPEVAEQADRLTEAIRTTAELGPDEEPTELTIIDAVENLVSGFDPEWGGFGSAPKFPQAMALDFLLAQYLRNPLPELEPVLGQTLDAMAAGGIYDHLGGGFARYSVDESWLVPHFEKMLCDQALLARTYLHAWMVSRAESYMQVLRETIEYVLRDLRNPDGAFHSSEDADSEGGEGRFYLWSPEELEEVLGPAAPAAAQWWGVTEQGNFGGLSILHRPSGGELIRPPEIEAARLELLAARSRRPRPGLDDKVLTEWNAGMVSTLAEAARATGEAGWQEAALKCAEFLLNRLRDDRRRWFHSWHADGGARDRALAADLAVLADAFVRLAELTGEARWITEACDVADQLLAEYWDDGRGGFFTTAHDAEPLVVRPKDLVDNTTPSANSMAAVALLRLAALTGRDDYRAKAEQVLRLISRFASSRPLFAGHGLMAIDMHVRGPVEIAVVGDRGDLLEVVNSTWLPSAVLAWGEPYPSPLWESREPGKAYVCRRFTCQEPTDTAGRLQEILDAAEHTFELHLTLPLELFAEQPVETLEYPDGPPTELEADPQPVQIKGLGRRGS